MKRILIYLILIIPLLVQAQKKCKPFIAKDDVTNETYELYGTVFNSGGVLGAIVGNADNSKETMTIMAGFRGNNTVMVFQLNRVVGENWRNKSNLRDLFIKKGEKIIVVTKDENIPFYTMEEAHSTYSNEGSGLSGSQERVSLQAVCLSKKSQIEKLANSDIIEIRFIITNGNASDVHPTKADKKRLAEKLQCLTTTEKFKNSPETPEIKLTSDEALGKLKKAKDKLDLGLMSQQQYDSIKAEMKKIIK